MVARNTADSLLRRETAAQEITASLGSLGADEMAGAKVPWFLAENLARDEAGEGRPTASLV